MDDSFDQEEIMKLLNSQIIFLNDKFKFYDKIIYDENPNKSKIYFNLIY